MKSISTKWVALTALTAIASACGAQNAGNETQEAWGSYDAPFHLDRSYEVRLDALPAEGQLSKIPWVDSYWPSYEGGISARWNTTNPQSFSYTSPSLGQLQNMTEQEIAELSPSEKFDIFNSRYDFPLTKSEMTRTSPNRPAWEGLCHGWAPAAAAYQEPKPTVVTNADGIRIPFGSADVKALLTYNQGQFANPATQFLGKRCNVKFSEVVSGRAEAEDCKGVNPGAFHIVLSNQIGLMNESFMADVTRDFEVWNHPIYGFSSRLMSKDGVSPGAAPGTVREVVAETRMVYTVEGQPQWNALAGQESAYTHVKTYQYRLELDGAGRIVGGAWLSSDRPDFLWKQAAASFSGYFSGLQSIYNSSIR